MTVAEIERLGYTVDLERGKARRARRDQAARDDGPAPPRKPRTPTLAVKPEHLEQAAFVGWVDANVGRFPHWHLRYAVPNFLGHVGEKGARMRAAQRATAEGRRKSVPDLVFPFARGRYHGLYLEMKRSDGGSLDQGQREYIAQLRAEGYAAVVCDGEEAARRVLLAYEALGAFDQHAPGLDLTAWSGVR